MNQSSDSQNNTSDAGDSDSNNKAIAAADSPIAVELEAGKSYYWCRCGRSAKQPFCDGSHKGSDISPLKFEADAASSNGKPAYLCRCKQTQNPPYCDGSHKQIGK